MTSLLRTQQIRKIISSSNKNHKQPMFYMLILKRKESACVFVDYVFYRSVTLEYLLLGLFHL